MTKEEILKEFEKFFNPNIVKKNLIRSSLYLTAFELLKYSVEKRLKNFLCIGEEMDENFEFKNSLKYRNEILNRRIPELNNNKNTYYSSCLWLHEHGIISKDEVQELQKIRLHRNEIGHELPKLMLDPSHEISLELFESIERLLIKIEQWWIIEFEMAVNPDFDDFDYDNLDLKEVKSGNMLILSHLIKLVKEEL